MARLRHCESSKSSRIGVMLALGLTGLFTAIETTWALPKNPIYKQCACICQAPGDIIGVITDFSNTGGYSCGAYNGKTCNYSDPTTGGVRSGTTKYCGPYKPGGTLNLRAPLVGTNGPILRRGLEGEQSLEGEMEIIVPSDETESGEIQERAVPRMPLAGGTTGTFTRPPRPSSPVAATTDVSCGDGKNYTISTGTKTGNCQVVRDGGRVIGGYCGDTKGNGSSLHCANGCTGATGAGSCSIKTQ